MFDENAINLRVLKERAYNLRWATIPDGVIPLTAADPDFKSAPEIADAICNFASDRYLCYGPPPGLPDFRESVSKWFRNNRNVNYEPEHIMAVDSAAFGIYLTCKTYLKAGDEAIIFDPVDFLFRYSVENVGAKAVSFAIAPGAADLDFVALEKLVTPKTKMLCLCNPLNPTGKVFTKQELKRYGEIAVKHDLIILSDEIWSDIIFEPHVYTSIAAINEKIYKQTITVTGYSKSYGLAGLRIGSVLAPDEANYKKLFETSLHGSTVHGANVMGQIAASAALNKCGDWLAGFVKHLQQMRDLCVKELNSIKGVKCIAPEGCYVAFADIRGTGKTSAQIHELLMRDAKVAVVPGLAQWFGDGAEGYIRISFATSGDILKEALTRIKNTLNSI
jgi:aminotransferase